MDGPSGTGSATRLPSSSPSFGATLSAGASLIPRQPGAAGHHGPPAPALLVTRKGEERPLSSSTSLFIPLAPPKPLAQPPRAQPVAGFGPFGRFGPQRAGLHRPERGTAENSSPPAFRLEDLHKLFPKASRPRETYSSSI